MWKSIKAKIKKEWNIRIRKKTIYDLKIESLRSQGMVIGNNVHIYSELYSKEPYLISIGDDTTISGEVILLTHDNSICKYLPQYTDIFGKITIGKNCFIGMRSMLLPGVTLADNTIVGAGAVVTKSVVTPGCIVAGCPAQIIGSTRGGKCESAEFYGFNIRGLTLEQKRILLMTHPEKMLQR